MDNKKFTTVDEYIALYPKDIQEKLMALRAVIKEAAPDSTEKISWGMPTFKLKKDLVHFAVHKNHIGFYPGADGVSNFIEKLGGYKTSKGAIQFPFSDPIPLELVREIVDFRVKQNLAL